MRVAIITIVSGRREHLVRQHRGLGRSTTPVDGYIVVGMNDATLSEWRPDHAPQPALEVFRSQHPLPLAAARNAGARRAIQDGAELLVFLDVDCIPSRDLVARYVAAAERHPDALLSGAVGYLGEDESEPAHFHGFRARLPDGETAPADPRLFWSLNFAATTATWRSIGGFCEDYSGYGGEDTDFAMLAMLAGVESLWVGGAEALHQFHPVSDPPVEHLDDILSNGERFAARWGFWPMEGWLREFEGLGLVTRDAGGWARVRVAS
jgi:GT2 family glycosyltransferase